MNNQRNLLLAVALSGLLILGWDMALRYFYPEASLSGSTAEESAPQQAGSTPGANGANPAASGAAGSIDGTANQQSGPVTLDAALASASRVKIDAPRIAGSINLVGAKIDDVVLKDHRQDIAKDSGPVRLFAPQGTEGQYFARFGFIANGNALADNIVWQADGEALTPETPVTLTHDNGAGLLFSVQLSVDDNYMITAEQSVQNTAEGEGAGAAIVQAFGRVQRTSLNATPTEFIVHAGPMGVFDDVADYDQEYEALAETPGGVIEPAGRPSWIGFSDRYWLSAIIPEAGKTVDATYRSLGNDLFTVDLVGDAVTVAAGTASTQSTQLFVGAKESQILDNYEETGITLFGKAISWGWFQIIEKPLLWLLRNLFELVGNFGVAIILLTCLIRGLLFPIAQKQFSSMAAMKAVQPKMKAIQERYKDDKQLQQQKIMELYKEEKVNPLAGCLPLLLQIPIFFALYKVLILAIEMRHEPFIFWLKDLSAPDPAKILNLFGLLPFDPPGFLGIGVLAVLLGLTMWMTFKLNPSAMDPMQQQIFNFMPWILMFVMAPFAAGLLLYWVTSNILTLAQQTYLYSRHPQLKAAAEKEKLEKAREAAKEEKAKG